MLKIENLSISYGENDVIKKFSYEFIDGKHYAIMGASGIGKTTLLNAIAGIVKPSSGSIIFDGKLSYAFQEPRLFPWLTSLENINVVVNDKSKALQILKRLINEDGIEKKYPHELSGGMQQRVAIGRAISADFDIMLMDEPFKGLDIETKTHVRQFVFDSLKGKTLLLVTHDEEDASLCDEVIYMNDIQTEESGKALFE